MTYTVLWNGAMKSLPGQSDDDRAWRLGTIGVYQQGPMTGKHLLTAEERERIAVRAPADVGPWSKSPSRPFLRQPVAVPKARPVRERCWCGRVSAPKRAQCHKHLARDRARQSQRARSKTRSEA